jgi:hypothetical protein
MAFLCSTALAAPVQVEICEQGLDGKDAWPAASLAATEMFHVPAFALDALPEKYVQDGVRGARPSPSLLRFTSELTWPSGRHRLLLRSRSAARLYINDVLLVQTPFPPKNGGDGSQKDIQRHQGIDIGKGYRFAPGGEFEKMAEFFSTGQPMKLRLEAFVGGLEGKKTRRVELGETVVAIAKAGTSEWQVLAEDGASFAYTDEAWQRYQKQVHADIAALNANARATLRTHADAQWKQRRVEAATWLKSTRDEPLPKLPTGHAAGSPVDHFIAAKFSQVLSQTPASKGDKVDFFGQVKPLLESRCVECHRGAKAKGGLRLDDAVAARAGGDTGVVFQPGVIKDSLLLHRIITDDEDKAMPPSGARLTAGEVKLLERWIAEGATWPDMPLARRSFSDAADDLAFLRRLMLDTVGVVPSLAEITAFQADRAADKRSRWIDKMLADPRHADAWMPQWQDMLAENPNMLNPTLNNTGPFRWWLHEALLDDLPVDRMVTQLVTLQGSAVTGGPAGFGLASQNDAPFAAKGTILGAAFLGVEMKCARCHDSPAGSTKQEQLFQLGAMLAEKAIDVPKTSSVDPQKLKHAGRKALIQVTLKPGSKVQPSWPFAKLNPHAELEGSPREQLAALLTAPENERFAQVIANRVWARLMGRGIVEPLEDWEKGKATHPELLRWLGRELVRSGYQLKALERVILNSAAYQRSTDSTLRAADPLYAAAEPRRLSAEQLVDSLYSSTGIALPQQPLCLDLNGRRDASNSVHLGHMQRAWMLTSLSNERDRPSLSLPELQAVTDVMEALGWRGARQDPSSTRDTAPNALQPAILANGVLSTWLTRLTDKHGLTAPIMAAKTADSLVDELFLRLLTRKPSAEEKARYVGYLKPGFSKRVLNDKPLNVPPHELPYVVTWTNHLLPEANLAKVKQAEATRRGDPPTQQLQSDWRQRSENLLWALINAPEMLYRP